MNYREPLTKNEIREHAAHYENSNPAVYCGTYAKYNNGSLYGMWIDLSTFENYHDFMEFCNRLHATHVPRLRALPGAVVLRGLHGRKHVR